MPDDGLPPVRDVIKSHGLLARKSLGQNFITDFQLLDKIARASGAGPELPVLEVGPGPGALTRALLKNGAQVFALERDARMVPALEAIRNRYETQFAFCVGDALEASDPFDGAPHRIVGNLPFNIATRLIRRWIDHEPWPPTFHSITVMIQRDVAQRILARPGTKDYGRLSVFCQWRTKVEYHFSIGPKNFLPAPKVHASLVTLKPRAHILPCDKATFSDLLQWVFSKRRKMLRSSLRGFFDDPQTSLEHLGLDPKARPETLGIEELVRLARLKSAQD